ncbi:MAG: clan AA aspartic protease [Chloroflexota bacterium]|nr:clan AA aspartic protease [Chloroflexota bacterium]MDE2896616.1 clan AA aspartic protease [Chloroflexota bacterium]
MIVGAVNERMEAILSLDVSGPDGRQRSVTALIDTGYSGFLTLPPDLIQTLELPRLGRGAAMLADGTEVGFDVYSGVTDWDGRQRTIQIDQADTAPLLGMAMLEQYDLHIEIRIGGRVTIAPQA